MVTLYEDLGGQPSPTTADARLQLPREQAKRHAKYGLAATAQWQSFESTPLKILGGQASIDAFCEARFDPHTPHILLSDIAMLAFGQATQAVANSAGKPAAVADVYARMATRYMTEVRRCMEALVALRKAETQSVPSPAKVTATPTVHTNVECVIAPTVNCVLPPVAAETPVESDRPATPRLDHAPQPSLAEAIGMPVPTKRPTKTSEGHETELSGLASN